VFGPEVVELIVPVFGLEAQIELPLNTSAVGFVTDVTSAVLLVDVQLVGAAPVAIT
jgi:hypothetical protein